MSEPIIEPTQPIKGRDISSVSKIQTGREEALEVEMMVSDEVSFEDDAESNLINPLAISRRFQPLEALKTKKSEKSEGKEEEVQGAKIEETEKVEEIINRTQKQNPELQKRALLALLASISEKDTPEEILKKVLSFYPDHTLADEALDFLLEATSGELARNILEAKNILNTQFAREINAGRNIAEQVKIYSKEGLAKPTDLRQLYKDVTGNPRTPLILFEQLSQAFPFAKLKSVIDFMLHSLGSDLKSKGPSIARPELLRLLEDTRALQAILGVYRFFYSRSQLINSQFDQYGMQAPKTLAFDNLSKQFVKLLAERYISPDKVYQLGKSLGINDTIIAQIIVFTQMRDAIRQVAPKLFRNEKHKQEVLGSLIETLEELEEKLEEEEQDEDEKEKDK